MRKDSLYLVRRISFLYLCPFLVLQRIHLLREEVVLQELHRAFGLARIDLVRSGVRRAVIFQVHDGKATVVPVGVGHDDGIRPVQVHGPCSQRLRFDVRTQRVAVHVIAHFAFLRQGIFLAVVYGRACKGYRIVRFAVQYVRLYNQSREAVAEVRSSLKVLYGISMFPIIFGAFGSGFRTSRMAVTVTLSSITPSSMLTSIFI